MTTLYYTPLSKKRATIKMVKTIIKIALDLIPTVKTLGYVGSKQCVYYKVP